jgi:hypothetical protein
MKLKSYMTALAALSLVVLGIGGLMNRDHAGQAEAASANDRADLAKRIQRIRDELAIERLQIDYGRRLDDKDFHAYAGNFASNGELVSGVGGAKGPDAIYHMLTDRLGGGGAPVGEAHSTFHLMTNPIIDIDGDQATGTVRYTFFTTGKDGRPHPQIAAHYRDQYIRENGQWKFLRRQSFADILPQNPLAGIGQADKKRTDKQ